MAIVLKYGAPGPILAAGYAAGVGHRQNEDKDNALKLWQQQTARNFQAGQAALDRQSRVELQTLAFDRQNQQAQLDRDFRAGQQQTALDYQANQESQRQNFQAGQQNSLLDARANESDLDRQQRSLEQRQREEFLAEQNTQAGLRRGELQLPQAAQRKLDQLEAGLVDAQKLSPAEQQEFREKYEAEKRNLLRLAKPSQEMPYDEQVRKKLGVNYEQYKNLPWQFNNQGEMSLPSGFKMPGDAQAESDQKYNEQVMKRYEKNLTEKNDDTGGPLYGDENKALQAAIDQQNIIERGRQRLLGRGAQPQAPAQPTAQATGEDSIWAARAAEGARNQSQAMLAGSGVNPPQNTQVSTSPKPPQMQQAINSLVPHPKTKEQFDALPSGAVFIGTDGKPRRKG